MSKLYTNIYYLCHANLKKDPAGPYFKGQIKRGIFENKRQILEAEGVASSHKIHRLYVLNVSSAADGVVIHEAN